MKNPEDTGAGELQANPKAGEPQGYSRTSQGDTQALRAATVTARMSETTADTWS